MAASTRNNGSGGHQANSIEQWGQCRSGKPTSYQCQKPHNAGSKVNPQPRFKIQRKIAPDPDGKHHWHPAQQMPALPQHGQL